MNHYTPDPALDLVLERTIPVAPERVWAAWTEPELMMQWFTPAPWKTVACEIEPAPDGGTQYRAIAMHANEEASTRHAEMGFAQGWGAALDQLVALLS